MKKIGLITYHNPCNYGATLQAYATVQYLRERGFDVDVINYVPSSMRGFAKFSTTYNSLQDNFIKRVLKSFVKTFSYKLMKKRFDKYVSDILPLTKEYYDYESLVQEKFDYDLFCSGSDQVWNNHYTKDFEKAFFLEFCDKSQKCFSFSSSFGKSEFSNDENELLKEYLQKYDFITVRELDGKKILNNLGYENSFQILDPTLMVNKDIWEKFASVNISEKNYVLVYQLHGDSDTLNKAVEFAKKHNLKVIKINAMAHQIRFNCKNILLPDFNTFISYFKNAEYVFTDSFHGTVFSIVFNKKLGITLPSNFSNRITTLLTLINANTFILKDVDEWYKNIDKIDYNEINEKFKEVQQDKINIMDNYLDKQR